MKRQINPEIVLDPIIPLEPAPLQATIPVESNDSGLKPADLNAQVEAARLKAEQLLANRQFDEAKKAVAEAERLEAIAERQPLVEAARAKATQLLAERRYADAMKALEEADALEAGPTTSDKWSKNVVTGLRDKMQNLRRAKTTEKAGVEAATESKAEVAGAGVGAVDESIRIVKLYSKIAAAVGLVPGGLLNFAAILAVQCIMVFKIAKTFNHVENKGRIRGAIISLIGSAIPAGIGQGAGIAVASIPAVITGTAIYFIATPILAYAMTQAVGKVFIMHFESGGTLLTFDPRAFGEHFLKEFKTAGGKVETEPRPEAMPVV